MPYLKLGNRNINYIRTVTDRLIVTSIINSSSSYQYPTLVRDSTTLDIYFGKEFPERDYFEELIDRGATLYLYRPVSTEKLYHEDYEKPDDVEAPDEEEYLPENFPIPENSVSWNNRDTLRLINTKGQFGKDFPFDYCYPDYNVEYEYKYEDREFINSINPEELEYDYDTFSFDLDFTNVTSFKPENKGDDAYYITLPVYRRNVLLWFRYSPDVYIPPIGGDFIGPATICIKTYNEDGTDVPREDIIDKIIEALRTPYIDGYGNQGFGYEISVGSDKNKIKIWRYYQETNSNFYKLPGLVINSDFRLNQDILSKISERAKRIEFYSKTIGKNDEDIKISINTVNYHPNRYRVTISRFDYEEVYDVDLYEDPESDDINIIDYTITRDSKLVTCRLIREVIVDGTSIPIKEPLPIGTWYLKGSEKEEYTCKERQKSLDILQYTEMLDDFLLIDDVNDWKDESAETITDSIYNRFLDYNIDKDNQTLIANRESTYKEYLFNKTSDKDNRLVYFYGDMKYYYRLRPPYYVFLNGILTDVYSVESKRIRYDVPSIQLQNELSIYKSNYLSDNNLFCYYYDYKNHKGDGKFNTGIITRFIISKIGRTIKQNKWSIVDKQTESGRKRVLNEIISNLINNYSMIINLTIESMEENASEHKLNINLKLLVSELVDKDITMSITLNYIE